MSEKPITLLDRLVPQSLDGNYRGHCAALWLLGIYVALKIAMSTNSIFNTEAVVVGADGIPVGNFSSEAARAVLMLFSLMALGQLILSLIALASLLRWRAAVPFIYLVLIVEHVARRFIVISYAVARPEGTPAGAYVNYALLALLAAGLLLSLIPTGRREYQ